MLITHNLGVVAEIADRVMVMYAGRIVERGDVVPVMTAPLMPYTRGLLRAVPTLDIADRPTPLASIAGTVPSPMALPPGCSFEPRCAYAVPGLCDAGVPPLDETTGGQQVRCVRWEEVAASEMRP